MFLSHLNDLKLLAFDKSKIVSQIKYHRHKHSPKPYQKLRLRHKKMHCISTVI